jgi:hypothetical protein
MGGCGVKEKGLSGSSSDGREMKEMVLQGGRGILVAGWNWQQ